jgi:endonuclease/exonuclease/phosphatase family metal-dependent hydrolase
MTGITWTPEKLKIDELVSVGRDRLNTGRPGTLPEERLIRKTGRAALKKALGPQKLSVEDLNALDDSGQRLLITDSKMAVKAHFLQHCRITYAHLSTTEIDTIIGHCEGIVSKESIGTHRRNWMIKMLKADVKKRAPHAARNLAERISLSPRGREAQAPPVNNPAAGPSDARDTTYQVRLVSWNFSGAGKAATSDKKRREIRGRILKAYLKQQIDRFLQPDVLLFQKYGCRVPTDVAWHTKMLQTLAELGYAAYEQHENDTKLNLIAVRSSEWQVDGVQGHGKSVDEIIRAVVGRSSPLNESDMDNAYEVACKRIFSLDLVHRSFSPLRFTVASFHGTNTTNEDKKHAQLNILRRVCNTLCNDVTGNLVVIGGDFNEDHESVERRWNNPAIARSNAATVDIHAPPVLARRRKHSIYYFFIARHGRNGLNPECKAMNLFPDPIPQVDALDYIHLQGNLAQELDKSEISRNGWRTVFDHDPVTLTFRLPRR